MNCLRLRFFRPAASTAPTVLLLLLSASPTVAQGPVAWLTRPFTTPRAEPGTPGWWEANKDKAELVPGEGYRVPGVDGYFDQAGRPINAPVDEVFEQFSGGDDKQAGLLPGLDPKVSYRRAKVAAGYGPDEQIARQALTEGEQLMSQRRYTDAEKQFKKAIDRLPDSAVANRAQFFLGSAYYFQDRYADARDAYEVLIADQPNTRQLDTVIEHLWQIGQYWEAHHFDYKPESALRPNFFDKTRPTLDTVGHAIRVYETIRLNDPTGPRADDAIMATAGIYFRRQQFHDADHHYTLLRQEYPRSDHQFEAHILGLQSKLSKYQGPDYDGTPLEEAKVLVKQIRTQFAGRLTDDEKERLRQSQAQVQLAIEQRDLRLALYYDNTEQYGAAKQIYARIARDHRGSPIAERAVTRLAELGSAPDVPPTKLAWLVDLFPENRERSRVAGVTEVPSGEAARLAEGPGDPGVVQPASATTTR
ncbi:MAG: outer membrane protein assembly factor BamD [Planctomycetota bacterium]